MFVTYSNTCYYNFELDLSFNILGDIGVVRFPRLNCWVVESNLKLDGDI